MDLSFRLTATRRGPAVSGLIINNLLFADDLVLIANDAITMQVLISTLSIWSKDFKMNISEDKTQIITSPEEEWRFYSFEEERYIGIDQVQSYKYLGLKVTRTLKRTSEDFLKNLITRATTYMTAIQRIKDCETDLIPTSLDLWTKVALPRFMYGIEIIPLGTNAISGLEKVQNILGKTLLGIRQSSANVLIAIDLGLKPLEGVMYSKKLNFYNKVMSPYYCGSVLVKGCMEYHQTVRTTSYMKEIIRIMRVLEIETITGWSTVLKRWERTNLIDNLSRMVTLTGVTPPRKWWRKANYVNDSEDSAIIASVRAGNCELGNRDNYMAAYAGANQTGRTTVCRLCTISTTLSEIHVIMSCPAMKEIREDIKLDGVKFDTWVVTETQSKGLVAAYQHLLDPDLLIKQRRSTVADILATILMEYKLKWTAQRQH
jgi:hypothetical protein